VFSCSLPEKETLEFRLPDTSVLLASGETAGVGDFGKLEEELEVWFPSVFDFIGAGFCRTIRRGFVDGLAEPMPTKPGPGSLEANGVNDGADMLLDCFNLCFASRACTDRFIASVCALSSVLMRSTSASYSPASRLLWDVRIVYRCWFL